MSIGLVIGCLVGAYLLGAIPFGVIIGRARGVNILAEGSRNPGATNVARLLGKPLGAVCLVLDMLKGAVPVIVAGVLFGLLGKRPTSVDPDVAVLTQGEMWFWLAVACAAVAGHMSSPFLGFRGGKGVATGFGGMVVMWAVLTFPALGALVVWYAVLRFTRFVSVASMSAAICLPLGYAISVLPNDPGALPDPVTDSLEQVLIGWPPLAVTALMAAAVVYKHRGNIARLCRGEEPKVRGGARRGEMGEANSD